MGANGATAVSQPIKRGNLVRLRHSWTSLDKEVTNVSVRGAEGGCFTQKAFYLNAYYNVSYIVLDLGMHPAIFKNNLLSCPELVLEGVYSTFSQLLL